MLAPDILVKILQGDVSPTLTLDNIENLRDLSLILTAEDSRKKSDIKGLGKGMWKVIRHYLKQDGESSALKTLKVRGINKETLEREEINILSGMLIIKKTVVKIDDSSRSVNSEDAWQKIIDAYEEHKEDIKKAGEVIVDELVLEI